MNPLPNQNDFVAAKPRSVPNVVRYVFVSDEWTADALEDSVRGCTLAASGPFVSWHREFEWPIPEDEASESAAPRVLESVKRCRELS
jgi:hypothetical protein